jgi:hypothetical protein
MLPTWLIIQILTLLQTLKPEFAFYTLTFNGRAKIIEQNNTYLTPDTQLII